MSTIDHQAFFIDGGWRQAQTDDRFEIVSPRSEQVIGHVPAASRADIGLNVNSICPGPDSCSIDRNGRPNSSSIDANGPVTAATESE